MTVSLSPMPDVPRGQIELVPAPGQHLAIGPLAIDRLALAAPSEGAGDLELARWQRRRTQLAAVSARVDAAALEAALATRREALAGAGITDVAIHFTDDTIAATARVADGLASAEVSFHAALVPRGRVVRVVVGGLRVHGHLPTPAPLIVQRLLEAACGGGEGVRVVGLLELEVDVATVTTWQLLPPAGWRLPSLELVRLTGLTIRPDAIRLELATSGDEPPPSPQGLAWAVAHAAMTAADELSRKGLLDDAMRGYRALLAAAGPDQPALLERILAITSARPTWFVDGRELARQALARWPEFVPALAALASIALAEGDTREAASRLAAVAQLAPRQGDRAGGILAALAAARLYRVIDPTAATPLYQRALALRPELREAEDALIGRLADERRWRELVAVLDGRGARADGRARAEAWAEAARIACDELGDLDGARALVARALEAAPIAAVQLAVGRVAAASGDARAAQAAFQAAAAAAVAAGERPIQQAALIARARLLDAGGDADAAAAAWDEAIAKGERGPELLAAAAAAAARADRHADAVAYGRALLAARPDDAAAELALGHSLLAVGALADGEAALGRACQGPAPIAAEARALLAEHRRDHDPVGAAALYDEAVAALLQVDLRARAAELVLARAALVPAAARQAELERAVELAGTDAPTVTRAAARALLAEAPTLAESSRWIAALLATAQSAGERAGLLGERARRALAEPGADLAAAATDAAAAAQLAAGGPAAAEYLGVAVAIERARGDARGLAHALDALVAARGASATTALLVDAAEAHLAADAGGRALTLAQAAAARAAVAGDRALADGDDLAERAVRALGEAAWRQRSFPDVARAYAALLVAPTAALDDDARACAEFRLATALERGGDAATAISLLERAAPRLPGDARGQAYRLLADLHERRGELTAAAAALEAYAEATDAQASTSARADALYRAGELFRRRPGHSADAVRCLEAALRLADDHLPALDALELIERDLGDLERVATILGRKIAASARQPSRQKALLVRLAAIHVQLERPDVARITLGRALELDAAYRPALHALAEIARSRGQRLELADALATLATTAGDDADATRDRTAAAIELGELVAIDPAGFPPAWRERTIAIVESLGAGASHPALAAVAERLRTPTATLVTSAAPRLDEVERARAAGRPDLARALLAEPAAAGDARALRELADVCAELADWPACAAALAALADANTDPPLHGHRRAEVLLELADIHYDRLGDLEAARATMRAAADAHGPSARRDATLRLLAAEASAVEDHGDAAAALEAIALDRRTPADVLALATAWQRRGHDHRAIAVLEAVEASTRLTDEGAMLLFALHQERRRKAELAAALERGAAAVPPGEARARLTDALGLYRDALGDDAASARVEAALAKLPATPGAPTPPRPGPGEPRRRTARPTEMERLAEAAAASGDHMAAADLYADAIAARVRAGGDPASLSDAIERVRAAARAAGHADALVRALFAVAARAPKPLAIDLYREAATTARLDLHDETIACDALIRAHRLAPGDGELVAALADALEAEGDLTRLADVYERAAAHALGGDRGRWLLALALLARDKLGDAHRARTHLDAAHEAAPELPTVWLPLADARIADDDLAGARELYERAASSLALDATTRAWASERLAALDRDADVQSGEIAAPRTRTAPRGSSPAPRAPAAASDAAPAAPVAPESTRRITLRGLASIRLADGAPVSDYERELRLGAELAAGDQLDAAIARYEAASVLAPTGDTRALLALEQLHDVRGDGEAVSDVIGRQIIATTEARPRARLWWRRAQLYRDTLHREADTYRCLKEAHASDPDDLDIAYELRAVAMARGEWALTAELLDREIANAPTSRDRGALHLELALVFDEKLLDPDAARRHYEAALGDDPTIPAVPRPLARIYELAGRYRDAATMLEQAAVLAPTGERAALYARAAADAARAGDRARAVDLANAAADAALAVGNHEAAARARAEASRLGAEPPPDEARAKDLDERERDLTRAIAERDGAGIESAARGVLTVAPAHPQAFRVLYERAEARSDWTTAAELCAARAAAESDPTERASHWFELGRLHADRRSDIRAAKAAWTRSLDTEPTFAPALDSLADLAYRERDLAVADSLYARLPVNTSRLPPDVVMLRRAEIAEALGEDGRALQLAQNAARLGPSRRDIYATCARLASRVGDLDAALRAARSGLELIVPDDIAALSSARLELAELCKRAGDTIGAVYYHELVVADEPHHARSLEALADLYVERGNWAGAARALKGLAATAASPDRRAEILYRLGDLTLARLGDVAGADDAFLRAADLDPSHQPTLRRLIDVYWRGGDAAALLEIAQELAAAGALLEPATAAPTLARVAIAAAAAGALNLAATVVQSFGAEAPARLAGALVELVGRAGELGLDGGVAAVAELHRRGHGPALATVAEPARGLGGAGQAAARALDQAAPH
ncbi:MAG: hypothetical protein IPL61_08005 [Myxococcales bacterium]|nr:hypothetical protein [Myxococcales bacterium]